MLFSMKMRNLLISFLLIGAITGGYAAAKSGSDWAVPITFSPPPGAASAEQRVIARELTKEVLGAVKKVLTAAPTDRCATLVSTFAVERLASQCVANGTAEVFSPSHVLVSVDSADEESATPATYHFQIYFNGEAAKYPAVATVYVRVPDVKLRVQTPGDIPSLINSSKAALN